MVKRRALKDAAQDPLARKGVAPTPEKATRRTHPVVIVLTFAVGLAGGLLMSRWLRIWI